MSSKIINGVSYNAFRAKRISLAQKCASTLGIKPLPAILYEYATYLSELPDLSAKAGEAGFASMKESSLLSIGLVYRYNGQIIVIDNNGNTLLLPDVAVIREELKKCGYLVCGLGSQYPDDIDVYSLNKSYDEVIKLTKYREKYTLPKELEEKVLQLEQFNSYVSEYRANTKGDFDIFDSTFYRGGLCSGYYSYEVMHHLDLTDKNARKYMAYSYSNPSYIEIGTVSDTLDSFVDKTLNNNVLNDHLYYSEDGLYNTLIGNSPRKK